MTNFTFLKHLPTSNHIQPKLIPHSTPPPTKLAYTLAVNKTVQENTSGSVRERILPDSCIYNCMQPPIVGITK